MIPLVKLLRETIVSNIPYKLLTKTDAQTSDLSQAERIEFAPNLPSLLAAGNNFKLIHDLSAPAGYKDYILLTIVFFVEHRSLEQAAYLQKSLSFWSAVGKDVPSVSFIDRRDLSEYLTGVSESSVWVQSIPITSQSASDKSNALSSGQDGLLYCFGIINGNLKIFV